MNVLSLFDGISCGQIALERAGIKYDNYFASEIDKNAIKVTMANYPDTIQLGDVTKWENWDIPKIDLLIGGSPCQGFSFAGKQLNFKDPRSRLFFEFVNILKTTKPKYFLFENVPMKQWCQDIISEHVGCEPIEINSALVSAQNRVRLYWTNIPNIKKPKDKNIYIKDILEKRVDEKYNIGHKIGVTINGKNSLNKLRLSKRTLDEKFRCLTAGGQTGTNAGATTIDIPGKILRKPTETECERAQTLPDGYTNYISMGQRYKAIGNSWTVDVIAHIFEGLKGGI